MKNLFLGIALLGTAAFALSAHADQIVPITPAVDGLFQLIDNPASTLEEIKAYLSSHAVARDASNADGNTPIEEAVEKKRVDLFKYLYESQQVDPSEGIYNLYTRVLDSYNIDLIHFIKEEAALHHQALFVDNNGETEFGRVVRGAGPETINSLIQEGALVNISVNDDEDTSLIQAAEWNHNAQSIQALIDAGARITASNKTGCTALMYASGNHTDVFRTLIDQALRVDPKVVNKAETHGGTALMFAANDEFDSSVRAKNIELLVKAGAKVNAADHGGDTALHLAALRSGIMPRGFKSYDDVGTADVVLELIKSGANPHLKNKDGHTALDYAKQALREETKKGNVLTGIRKIISILQQYEVPKTQSKN